MGPQSVRQSAANCLICPCTDYCEGENAALPVASQEGRPEARAGRKGIAFWIERADGAILLRRRTGERPARRHDGNPLDPMGSENAAKVAAPVKAKWTKLKTPVEHTFTHFHLQLAVWKTAQKLEFPHLR